MSLNEQVQKELSSKLNTEQVVDDSVNAKMEQIEELQRQLEELKDTHKASLQSHQTQVKDLKTESEATTT